MPGMPEAAPARSASDRYDRSPASIGQNGTAQDAEGLSHLSAKDRLLRLIIE